MLCEFSNDGVRYSLVVTLRSRRDSEVTLEQIKPDLRLWTSKERRRHSCAPKVRQTRLGPLDEVTEVVKAVDDRRHHYKQPDPKEFEDGPQ